MYPTRFSTLTRFEARLVLVLLLAAIALCVGITLSPVAQGHADSNRAGSNDVDLYRAEVQRMVDGEPYYDVVAEELPARGYPTRSVFNWRTPLPMWLIAKLPHPSFGKALLCVVALGVFLLAFEVSAREGGRLQSALCALLLIGGFLPCFLADLYVMPSLWAGALIALSVCALSVGWNRLGITAGIVAVFFRDLAGPYCVLGLGYAVCRRRWKQVAGWLAGLAAYGLFFLWHCWQVGQHRLPDASAHAEGWMQLGGAAFVIATTQMNGFLLVMPQWVTAIYLPLALLGFISWSNGPGRIAALAAAAYIALFSVVGQEFNQYWGSLTAPLLCLGAARSPLALRDLFKRAELLSTAATMNTSTT